MPYAPLHHTRPRPVHELVTDINDELYRAVYVGDLEAARAKVDELAMVGGDALRARIHAAKRRATA